MRDFLFILGLVILAVIALKVLLWTLKNILIFAVVAGVIYLIVRSGVFKRLKK